MSNRYIRWFEEITIQDVPLVGGKNASLGEMTRALQEEEINVPDGFAITAEAYRDFIEVNQLGEKIQFYLEELQAKREPLERVGRLIRRLFIQTKFPDNFVEEVQQAYQALSQRYQTTDVDVAVRSSATAEDLPEASFAGQQESFLNIKGVEEVLEASRKCFASLFTDRAIVYREKQGFEHLEVALSIVVQKMVRSDLAGSGVMFTIDTESGYSKVAVINAAWGLGESVVQGTVTPDEYVVFKPLLEEQKFSPIVEKKLGAKEKKMIYAQGGSKTIASVETSWKERMNFVLDDQEVLKLGRWAKRIEDHYQRPMDIEWAKDGESGELFIVQARPETVQSQKNKHALNTFSLKEPGERLLEGLSIGNSIATGKVCLIKSVSDIEDFVDGSILVTEMTDPDWVPVMQRAAGIVTDHGGRTCHAAIVSRELGVPAVVGTGNATQMLEDQQEVTLSCSEGYYGYIYQGLLDFSQSEIDLEHLPETKTQIMLNLASPDSAFDWWQLPNRGVGLARMEFIINNVIKIHPMALVKYNEIEDEDTIQLINDMTYGYVHKKDYFVDKLALGIAKIAASQYPEPVIVRMSDFKTNEYANLIGGSAFEPKEENPMIGFRGASRYYSERYREGFALECQAIKRVRESMGFDNVLIMIPFCRTLTEADKVLTVLAENGLSRGENDLQVYVMCEVPSNVLLADQFADRFDGFSIGSNDLTQLTLGVDRDSSDLAEIFDERNEAVKIMIKNVIKAAKAKNRKVGICGQGPSDYPDFAAFLVQEGIDSISLNPDSVPETTKRIAQEEAKLNE